MPASSNSTSLTVFIVIMLVLAVIAMNIPAYRKCDNEGGEIVKSASGKLVCAKIVIIN